MPSLYRILEYPFVYRAAQALLAPGGTRMMDRQIAELLAELPGEARLLDIGCGPESHLAHHGLRPTGLDLSVRYLSTLRRSGVSGVAASADGLPFATGSFDGIWSVGLLHHLPDAVVRGVMAECARAARRPGGYLAIIDAVLPHSPWRRPIAHWIRRADRGRFVRTEAELRALLHPEFAWSTRRFTWTLTGLEALACVCRFEPRGTA